jgi:hypothetical protein
MWLALRGIFGTIWAWVVLILGLHLWHQRFTWGQSIDPLQGPALMRAAAFWCIVAAQFVFMVLVADALVPRVPMVARLTLKWFVGTGFYVSLIWLGVLGYRLFWAALPNV